MFDNSSIILIVLIGIFLLVLFFNNDNSGEVKQEKEIDIVVDDNYIKKKKKRRSNRNINENDLAYDILSWDNDGSSVIKKVKLNPNFLNVQFHNDYRDVLTAFNNIIPERGQRFNLANIPLVYSEPDLNNSEVKHLLSDFVEVVNSNLKKEVPSVRNKNSGWDEAIPDPNMRSGWDKVQNSLGLTSSLYEKPKVCETRLDLIKIKFIQKYETDDEIKYLCEAVLQKVDVDDQLVIKASFVQDKKPLYDENNFNMSVEVKLRVIIEDIFIVGFLSKEGNDEKLDYDNQPVKFFNYNDMEENNMTDPKEIQKVLLQKYDIRTKEMEGRNALLDEEGQSFHRQIPNIYDFSNIRGTRTIFDDMNGKKTFI